MWHIQETGEVNTGFRWVYLSKSYRLRRTRENNIIIDIQEVELVTQYKERWQTLVNAVINIYNIQYNQEMHNTFTT